MKNIAHVPFCATSAFIAALILSFAPATVALGQGPQARAKSGQEPPVQASPTLENALKHASAALERMEQVADYTCNFVKRERIDGVLSPYESMRLKVRHEPFSVYLYCLGPNLPKGQEVIYVEGQNDGLALAHTTGLTNALVGTLQLDPMGARMMNGNRYPITNIGMKNLLNRMVRRLEKHIQSEGDGGAESFQVRILPRSKIDDEECTCVEVRSVEQQKGVTEQMTRIFYHDEHGVPVRLERYDWPPRGQTRPLLVEEYNYRSLKLNQDIGDADFSTENPEYEF